MTRILFCPQHLHVFTHLGSLLCLCCVFPRRLFITPDNASARQIVRCQLQQYSVTGKDFDVAHPHFPGDMCQDLVSVIQFNAEHSIGKGFENGPFCLY